MLALIDNSVPAVLMINQTIKSQKVIFIDRALVTTQFCERGGEASMATVRLGCLQIFLKKAVTTYPNDRITLVSGIPPHTT